MGAPMALEMTPEEYESARDEWFAAAEDVIERLAATGDEFSFDAVRRELPEALHPNHYGQLMRRRRIRALVEPVGVAPSGIRSRKGGWSQRYRGLQGVVWDAS